MLLQNGRLSTHFNNKEKNFSLLLHCARTHYVMLINIAFLVVCMATDGSPFANADLVAEPEAASSEKGDTLRFC